MGSKTYLEIGKDFINIVQIEGKELIYQQSYLFKDKCNQEELSNYLHTVPNSINNLSLIIPSIHLFSKVFVLPLQAQGRIEEIINLEFLSNLPYPEQDIYYSYYLQRDKQKLIVFVFAVNKDFLNKIYNSLKELDITIKEILPAPLIYYFEQEGFKSNKPTLYLDKVKYYLNFSFFSQDNVYLRSCKSTHVQEELEKTLEFLKENYQFEEEIKLIVNGQEIETKNNKLLDKLKNRDESADFWFKLKGNKKKFKGKDFLNNLEQGVTKVSKLAYLSLILVFLIIIINGVTFNLQRQAELRHLKDLEQTITEIMPTLTEIEAFNHDLEGYKQKLQLLEREINYNQAYLPYLQELSKILPQEVVIEQLLFQEDKLVVLRGKSPSATAVMSKLKASPYFEQLVFLTSITISEDGESFQIAGELRYELK